MFSPATDGDFGQRAVDEAGTPKPDGEVVTMVYDQADRLTCTTDKTSGRTTLGSFSYVLDYDGRRTQLTETDGSVVGFTYDWGSRLTQEVRTPVCQFTYYIHLRRLPGRHAA